MRFLCSVVAAFVLRTLVTGEQVDSGVTVRNDSERPIKVSWINPNTSERIFLAEILDDSERLLNSYVGHDFEIEELGSCEKKDICIVASFRVLRAPEQFFIVDDDFNVIEMNNLDNIPKRKAQSPEEKFPKCRQRAKKQLENIVAGDVDTKRAVMEELNECLKRGLAPAIREGTNEIVFERKTRETVSRQMENFTCTDPDLGTSPDVEFREWTSEKDGKTRSVHVKLDRPASRIHVVEDFAYSEECRAMEETAEDKLRRASTADGKGGTQISQNRKAMQAGITPNWSEEADGDLVARLSRRVYDYVNYELGLNLGEHGQEPLMSIQYFGRGYNDTEPDRYTPHCDGACEGQAHVSGSRMATMVIYCAIPEKGGHTNFQNANVHIKPEVGSAIFFSYIDPVTNITDYSLTQHSGCPVFEGEKKIITQWVRFGVSKDTPHYAFNTLGVLKKESGE